ncbi:VOC family protein [uncultured Jatrophihabitans sp.]|uniref:VOC family protein n=1 Tax=uncultured Jatrophihabitans sp. TaxID=1610747 RepID=UPI0035C99743
MTTTDAPTGVLAAVALDAADPEPEAHFWRDLLGLEVIWQTEDFVALRGAAVLITVQRVAHHQPPTWPADEVAKQIHLEVSVTDLDAAEQSALALGAVRAAEQPRPDKWRVLIDPAGHPFCVSNQIPAP